MRRFRLVLVEKKKKTDDAENDDLELLIDGDHEYGSEVAAAFGNDPKAKLQKRPKPHVIEPVKMPSNAKSPTPGAQKLDR